MSEKPMPDVCMMIVTDSDGGEHELLARFPAPKSLCAGGWKVSKVFFEKHHVDALNAKIAALEKDAARMDWIQQNVLCADFEYPLSDATTSVLCIKWPTKIGVSANVRASIDAAMKGGA